MTYNDPSASRVGPIPEPPVQAGRSTPMPKSKTASDDRKAVVSTRTAAEDVKAERKATEESNVRRQEIVDDERDPNAPRYLERTPRDIAINRTKEGEDVGLESSRPDRTERFRVPGRFVGRGRFEDFDGRVWEVSKVKESQAARIDPEAVRKDGGDPHLLGVASAEPHLIERGEVPEKSIIPTSIGNAQPSEDPVEGPKDRARIAATDGPSTRPGSRNARIAKAEAEFAAENEVKVTRGKSGAKAESKSKEQPGRLARAKAALRKK